jgi:hypothetical protein
MRVTSWTGGDTCKAGDLNTLVFVVWGDFSALLREGKARHRLEGRGQESTQREVSAAQSNFEIPEEFTKRQEIVNPLMKRGWAGIGVRKTHERALAVMNTEARIAIEWRRRRRMMQLQARLRLWGGTGA